MNTVESTAKFPVPLASWFQNFVNGLRKKSPRDFVIPSEARNLSFFSSA
jgi:hypothetical protein